MAAATAAASEVAHSLTAFTSTQHASLSRPKSIEKNSWYRKVWGKSGDTEKVVDKQPEAVGMSARGQNTKKPGEAGNKDFVKRITNDAREDEMNENLG